MTERLQVAPHERGVGGWDLRAHPVLPGYVKDYDSIPGHRPSEWADRWDLGKGWFAAAFVEGRRVGGAAVVLDAREMEGAADSADAALLWDIRVHPDCRRRGVGRRLLGFAEDHARARGVRRMQVETQDVNVPACRFYAGAGYVLDRMNRFAYADLLDEIQLIWKKDLA